MEISTKEALAELKQELINEMWGGVDPTPDWNNMSIHNLWTGSGPYTGAPWTVTEDGWIRAAAASTTSCDLYVWSDDGETSPSSIQEAVQLGLSVVRNAGDTGPASVESSSGWAPVKKGDVISTSYTSKTGSYPYQVLFAPCKGNSAKTN